MEEEEEMDGSGGARREEGGNGREEEISRGGSGAFLGFLFFLKKYYIYIYINLNNYIKLII